MTLVLSMHPVFQCIAILLAYYAGFLGIQRIRSLHLGQPVQFERERHVLVGAAALLALLGGFAGGLIIAARLLAGQPGLDLHEKVAFVLLPFLVFGIFSGFFLYLNPGKRTLLPAVHGINNLIVLVLVLVQIYTGLQIYLTNVLGR